ncbi:helix-turn-helix domain-containing protein [Kribbella shirazensis]|uniref:Transcriptional regulator with XRE-family HTH domain/tetratricopeptide (TPR) repeat protein n=1 Tax=Kribbella shirazensis TaxID=1105143 RepID=A0A7X5VBN1_9ACTN|nr:helix-turn-helix transcriptional regulator [Kribbella shirazensis]NIK58241.1 transcriptional regulator with XRE-family HTH domain/tetratricopeptide (TPR) repeat protein [Kribbella shirazensis]
MTASQPPLDSAWWDRPELRSVLATRDVAGIFRWLQRHGWSQTQIGARTYQSQGEVSEILKGRQVKAYDVLERIADALEIPRGLMGLAYSTTSQPAADECRVLTIDDRRNFAGAVASVAFGSVNDEAKKWLPEFAGSVGTVPAVITESDVQQVVSITVELRKLDQRYGGGAAVDASLGFYGYARRMIHSAADAGTHRDLKVSLADFSSMLGWSFHDIGDQSSARRYLMNALVLAKDADEPSLASSILYRLGRVSMQEAQPAEALRMLQLGQLAAQDAGDPAEVARLHANEALAYAMLGKHDHVQDALARAEHEMGRADRSRVSPWTTLYFTPGDYTGHQALVYNSLAGYTKDRRQSREYAVRAVALAHQALQESGPDRSRRSKTFDRIILSTNLLRTNEIDTGIEVAHQVISETQTLRSGRGIGRLAEIATAAADLPDNADTKELVQQLGTVRKTALKALTA